METVNAKGPGLQRKRSFGLSVQCKAFLQNGTMLADNFVVFNIPADLASHHAQVLDLNDRYVFLAAMPSDWRGCCPAKPLDISIGDTNALYAPWENFPVGGFCCFLPLGRACRLCCLDRRTTPAVLRGCFGRGRADCDVAQRLDHWHRIFGVCSNPIFRLGHSVSDPEKTFLQRGSA